MSEYMEKHTASRLIGAPPGYVGYEEGGRLTSAVKRRPYSIILLDEIEKAHPDIFNLLLQIMEDGRLTDGQGVTVDFRNCVILMTSNACAEMMSDRRSLGFAADADTAVANQKQNILQGIKDIFRPEFLNRLDEIIVFDPLGKKELAQIVDKMLEELQKRLQDTGMSLRMTAAARDKLLQTGPGRDLFRRGSYSDRRIERRFQFFPSEGSRNGKHGTGARGTELWLKQKRK